MGTDRARRLVLRRVPTAQSFRARVACRDITMPNGVAVNSIVRCVPVFGGTAVYYSGKPKEKPDFFRGLEFDQYFEILPGA